jgi:hypothetical protein
MDIPGSKTYHRGEGFVIASLPGFKGPLILLEPELATRLGRIWYSANVRMATTFPGQGVDAVRDLCAVLAPIFTHFGSAMVESGAEDPLPRDVHAMQRELDRIAKLLEEFDPDNWPGGKGGQSGGKGKA